MSGRALPCLLATLAIAASAHGCERVEGIETDEPRDTVVLLHGLGRSSRSMEPMAEALRAAGYEVVNFDYPSTRETVEGQAARLEKTLETCCPPGDGARVHFVGHSLGAIIVRYYLATRELDRLGRVVMLSPPNNGSEVVDALRDMGLEGAVGPAGELLGTGEWSLPSSLPPVDFELGVIAGDASINPLFSVLIPGSDDGTVSVASARTEGMSDFLVVPHSHTFIMRSDLVIEQTCAFLRNGRFDLLEPEAGSEREARSEGAAPPGAGALEE